MVFFHFLILFHLLLIYQVLSNSLDHINLTISSSTNYTFAPWNDDHIYAIINSKNQIMIGGSTCSYLGLVCKVFIEIFDKDFKIELKKMWNSQTKYEKCISFKESSLGTYLISIYSYNNGIPDLIIYHIHSDLEIIENVIYTISPDHLSDNRKSNIVEVKKQRHFFRYYLTVGANYCNFQCEDVRVLDIQISPFSIVNKSFIEKLNEDICALPYCGKFFSSALQIDLSNYYICGSCSDDKNQTFAYIAHYYLGEYKSIYTYHTSQSACNYLQVLDVNDLLMSYDLENTGIKFLRVKTIPILHASDDFTLAFPNGLAPTFQNSGLIIGSYLYFLASLRDSIHPLSFDSSFSIFDLIQASNPIIPLKFIQFYESIGCPYSICSSTFSFDFYQINQTMILVNEILQYQNSDFDLTIHLIDLNDPNFKNNLVFGGSGDYTTCNLIELKNLGIYMAYGIDGLGVYFLEISEENLHIKNENKFRMEYPIIDCTVLSLSNGKSILLGNYKTYNGGVIFFIAEIDKFFYATKVTGKLWMNDLQIKAAINKDITHFIIAGMKKVAGADYCYSAIINLDYSLQGLPSLITINGEGCCIYSILLSYGHKLIAVGQNTVTLRGILINFDYEIYIIIDSLKNIRLTSILEMSSNFFISGGVLTENSRTISYMVSFKADLSSLSAIIDLGSFLNTPSLTSNLIKINQEMFISAISCLNRGCISFILSNPLMIKENYPFGSILSPSFWSIKHPDNKTIIAFGAGKILVNDNPSIYTANLILSPDCPDYHLFNQDDFKCYFNCLNSPFNEYYNCIKSKGIICLKCVLKEGFICTQDYFSGNLQKDPCIRNSALSIVPTTILYDSFDKKISANFSDKVLFFYSLIKLSILDNVNHSLPLIKYNQYTINQNHIEIKGVKLLTKNLTKYIEVDLTQLRITNAFGSPLINPKFYIKIVKDDNSEENPLQSLASYLSSFINNNKYNLIGII